MKRLKIIAILSIVNILLVLLLNSYTYKIMAVTQNVTTEINSINTKKYPEIKEKIDSLKKQHPNWNFKILYTGIDWNEAISSEYTGHGSSPKNLVPASSSYAGEWICEYCGDTAYDSGSWKCASAKAIKYMMDPRASLNSSDIFQFLELSYNQSTGYSKDVIYQMLSGSFLNNEQYINTIMNSCKQYNVNPYYIIARIIQEQGKNGTILSSGNGYNGQYVGYYNIFNIGASGSNKEKVILNGLAKAKKYDWTSVEKALNGGIEIIASSYISVGQNTLYFQKFDVENSDGKLYWHQYMQNIMAAQNEGTILRKTFQGIDAIDNAYTFIIPVYENMPANTSTRPSLTRNSATENVDLVEANVTTSIRIRNAPAGSTTLGYLYKGEVATRIEKATEKVNGTYWDKILKNDGTTGYVARCTYDYESNYKEYLLAINEEKDNHSNDNMSVDTTNNQTNQQTSNKEITKGDVNEDNTRDSADLLYLKKYLLNKVQLTDDQKKAADTNNDNNIDSADLLNIKKFLLGKISL